MINKHKFAVLSFYSSTDEISQQMDEFLEPVKIAIDERFSSGQLPKVDIGWFRIDIEKYAELEKDFPFASDIPDIIVYSYHTHYD